jgi:hypothetical protein
MAACGVYANPFLVNDVDKVVKSAIKIVEDEVRIHGK